MTDQNSATLLVRETSEKLDALPVCPWPKNSSRLVSLWDIMRHFMVWQLAKALDVARECEDAQRVKIIAGLGDAVVPIEERDRVSQWLKYCHRQFVEAELQSAIERIDGPFRMRLRDGLTYAELHMEMRVLRESVEAELRYRRFAYVPTDKAAILDSIDRTWEPVWVQLKGVEHDTREAVDCYALGKATACVFHSMRIAEFGLRALARKLKVVLTHRGKAHPIEFADWEKVITAINNKIASARALPQGRRRAATIQFYADAADHCLYMKDIWRNEVSHTRKSYKDTEALGALQRVHDFMVFLARGTTP